MLGVHYQEVAGKNSRLTRKTGGATMGRIDPVECIGGCDYMVPYKYALYASKEVMDMYIDFMNITDNPLGFEVPEGFLITEDMMNTFIGAAYAIKGEAISNDGN